MSKSSLPAAVLKPGEERRLQRGHLWAYRNEFSVLPDLSDGGVFDIFSATRRFVCRAFYQAEGGIAGRVLSRHQDTVDAAFLRGRLARASGLRQRLFPDSTVYRWIHGESDGLPGLVIDRYDSVAAVQSSCAFYREQRDVLAELLLETETLESVALLDAAGAETRGKPLEAREISIDGLRAGVSFDSPQKTGLFLDQRENWPMIRRFAQGAVVLDGYCHHGFWGIHAALGGAKRVLGIDSSEPAVARARINADLNGVAPRCAFERMRVEEILDRGDNFDVIVLDPPAFSKTRGQAGKAMAQYEEINRKALKALNPDGILITCSCSHFMPLDRFMEAIKRASRSASRTVRVLAVRGAGPDHPVLPVMPETEYLKCVFLHTD
ncbi:MAG: class I SAM-dependent rRNA methyltransferase [Candidatus Hydrogenedentes bacterium]|nr:class I SAM-dependent rRNA methyltransferase [Candidatus Hydrogenedentota bacterium]